MTQVSPDFNGEFASFALRRGSHDQGSSICIRATSALDDGRLTANGGLWTPTENALAAVQVRMPRDVGEGDEC